MRRRHQRRRHQRRPVLRLTAWPTVLHGQDDALTTYPAYASPPSSVGVTDSPRSATGDKPSSPQRASLRRGSGLWLRRGARAAR